MSADDSNHVTFAASNMIDLGLEGAHTSSIDALRRARPFISMHTAIKIYKSLITPHFDYCSVVWDGLSRQLSEKLKTLKKIALLD